jgi:hypothetical protein
VQCNRHAAHQSTGPSVLAGTEQAATAGLHRAAAAASRMHRPVKSPTANKTPVARGVWAVPKPTAARTSRKPPELQGGQGGMAGPNMRLSSSLAATTADAAAADTAVGLLNGGHVQNGATARGMILRRGKKLADVPRCGGTIGSSGRRMQGSPGHRQTIVAKEYHYDPPVRRRARLQLLVCPACDSDSMRRCMTVSCRSSEPAHGQHPSA